MPTLRAWISTAIRQAGWAPAVVFGIHIVISRVFGAYLTVPELDIPMHFLGGVAIASFFRHALALDEARAWIGRPSELGRDLFSLAAVCAAALNWEFAEWTTDRLGLTRAQLGLEDTLLDMAFGVVGGVAFLVVRRRAAARSTAAPRAL